MIVCKEDLYYKWSIGSSYIINSKKYRVGKMSYGDYFLETGKDRGELGNFNKGTIWPQKIEGKNDLYEIKEKE